MSEGLHDAWRFKELSDKRYLCHKIYLNLIKFNKLITTKNNCKMKNRSFNRKSWRRMSGTH